ncbi:MAG: hypothetical protein HEEMFOPI_01888 [Holosporales bacterium]
MELSEKDFWISFWEKITLPEKVDTSFKNDRVISNFFLRHLSSKSEKAAIEIGCAPGKWLVFIKKNLGYSVTGLEYLEIAAKKTEENLRRQGVQGKIIKGDFLEFSTNTKYDLVYSLGFVEHFDDYHYILNKHKFLVKSGGDVIIGYPSFVGLTYFTQRLIEFFGGQAYLAKHNLKLDKQELKEWAFKSNMDLVEISNIGGFEPSLFPVSTIPNKFFRFFLKSLIYFLGIIFGRVNSRFTASYVMGCFRAR